MKIEIITQASADGEDFGRMLAEMYRAYTDGSVSQPITHAQGKRRVGEIVVTFQGSFEGVDAEAGVHRLVRFSPFDAQHRRTTVFANVVIDGKWEDKQVASYVLDPYATAKNHILGIEQDDPLEVLAGKPLALRKVG